MMNASKIFSSLALMGLLLSGSQAFAQSKSKKARTTKTTKSTNVIDQRKRPSGADSEEGWVVRRTDKGLVKVPKKQKFNFEGVDVTGDVQRPAQSVLGARSGRQNRSLIPVRTSFREEFLSASGLQD